MLARGIQFVLRRFGLRLARIRTDAQVIAPFNVFEHVVCNVAREVGDGFRFIQVGESGNPLEDLLTPIAHKYGISGKVVPAESHVHFREACRQLESGRLELLYLDTTNRPDMVIEQTFHENVFPTIISYAFADLHPECNHELKLKLLDQGYRFIEVGPSTICVKE